MSTTPDKAKKHKENHAFSLHGQHTSALSASKVLTNLLKKSIIKGGRVVPLFRAQVRVMFKKLTHYSAAKRDHTSTLNQFSKLLPSGRKDSVMNTLFMPFKKMRGSFAATLAILLTAVFLTACGGGGSGGDLTVATSGAQSDSQAASALISAKAEVLKVAMSKQLLKPHAATQRTTSLSMTEVLNLYEGANQNLYPGHEVDHAGNAPEYGDFIFRYYPLNDSYLAATSTAVYTLFASAPAPALTMVGNTADIACNMMPSSCVSQPDEHGCVAPQVWTPGIGTCAYPVGVKVENPLQIASTCLTWKDPCWSKAIADKIPKFIETPQKMTNLVTNSGIDQSNRNVDFAFFRGPTGFWKIMLFYRDTGEAVGSDLTGGSTGEIDWVVGTTSGLIVHYKLQQVCYEWTWYPPTTQPGISSNVWAVDLPITCPF